MVFHGLIQNMKKILLFTAPENEKKEIKTMLSHQSDASTCNFNSSGECYKTIRRLQISYDSCIATGTFIH